MAIDQSELCCPSIDPRCLAGRPQEELNSTCIKSEAMAAMMNSHSVLDNQGARRNHQAASRKQSPNPFPPFSSQHWKPAVTMSQVEKKGDVESQKDVPAQPEIKEATSDTPSDDDDQGLNDNSKVPQMSYLKLFWFFFYNFGLFAWGGPVAQIALIKDKLVTKDKWITLPRFQRVFSVYQILPGPEAAELCMFFGCLSAGRLGGIIAGLAFILPGFVLMLLASYLYTLAGFENKYFNASFRSLQPIVAAMVSFPCPSIQLSPTDWNPYVDLEGNSQDRRALCEKARYQEGRPVPYYRGCLHGDQLRTPPQHVSLPKPPRSRLAPIPLSSEAKADQTNPTASSPSACTASSTCSSPAACGSLPVCSSSCNTSATLSTSFSVACPLPSRWPLAWPGRRP